MADLIDALSSHGPYLVVWVLLSIGLGLALISRHLLRCLIGLYLIQTSVILFYLAIGAVSGGSAPILPAHPHEASLRYANPLPHVLMLTAIVVGISTQGVALMLLRRLYRTHRTLLDDELRRQLLS